MEIGIKNVATGTGQIQDVAAKAKDTKGNGAFGDLIQTMQEVKTQGAQYEKASSGQATGDDDWVTLLAQLQTDLQVIKRLGDELMAAAKEISHFQV